MRNETKRNFRVGLLTIAALALVALTIMMVGNRRQIFLRHTQYRTSFRNVTGLERGAPVKLNGVTVGEVQIIELPAEAEEQRIRVRFTVDARYTERIRQDSKASIRSMGLLGDRYLEVTSGAHQSERILEGGLVPGHDPAELSEFVSTGEDLLDNLTAISVSLKNILQRVEAGQGILGELTTEPEAGGKLTESLSSTISTLGTILARVERGEGLLGRLVREDSSTTTMLDELVATSRSVHRITTQAAIDIERHDTAYAALLRDPEGRRRIEESIDAMHKAASAIAAVAEEMASGEGTLPRLMQDKEFADDFLEDLYGLVNSLRSTAEKLDRGDGTAGAFINDTQLYQDLEDVVRGVKNSKVVSWFIRNKREKGEDLRLEEEAESGETADGQPISTG
ncbi:MAG: MlaD family protein [Thermoanaerobaculales bacterium]|nr:MlaD family protein [Thermoanaerobaculales bacterium]